MFPILSQKFAKKIYKQNTAKTLMTSLLFLITIFSSFLLPKGTQSFLFEPGSGKKHWTYEDQIDWDAKFRSCGLRSQSPIDIQSNLVQENPNLKLQFFNYDKQIKFKLQNAHHTIKLSPIIENYLNNNNNNDIDHRHNRASGSIQRPAHSVVHGRRSGGNNPSEFVSSNGQIAAADMSSAASFQKHPFFESAEEMLYMNKSLPDLMVPVTDQASATTTTNSIDNNRDLSQQENNNSKSYINSNINNNNNNNNNNDKDSDTVSENKSLIAGDPMESAAIQSNLDANPYLDNDHKARNMLYDGKPTVKLSTLDDENNIFHLHDIHLHWGERKDNGSEHAIDGRRGAMELHLVHIRSGLNKSSIEFNSDSLLVIGIIIESQRKSNAQFDPIVNSLTRINMTAEPEEIGYRSLLELLPDQLDRFYWYWGSLTTPPCYEVVNWIVMERRLTMNSKQIEMFRQLYAAIDEHKNSNDDDDDHDMPNLIMPNIRSLQPVFDRPIFGTKGLGKRTTSLSTNNIHKTIQNYSNNNRLQQQQDNQLQQTVNFPTSRIIVGINDDRNFFKSQIAENPNEDFFSHSNSHAISSMRVHNLIVSSPLTIATLLSFFTSNLLLGFLIITSISFNMISPKS